jgi:proline iminopeptidase
MIKILENLRDIKFVAIVIILLSTFQATAQLYPHEGYINVKGGKVWYRIVGNSNKTPLLLLHGGPGSTSYYLNPLKELAKDRPVIFFDQLGCGRSSRITDTSLMTLDNYVDEVEQLKTALGITEYFLYGHSWGTMLAMDFYLKHPEGIKAIVFGSPLFSTDLWISDAKTLIETLPDSVQQIIYVNEQNQTYSSPDYQAAVQIYYHHFLRRTERYLTDIDSTKKTFGENVYEYMWGPSEFKATGTLKDYNRLQYLDKISVPVLLTCGDYDEATPATVKYYQSLLPGSKLIVIKNSGHLTMIDNTEDNNNAIEDFLMRLDKK